MEYEAVEVGLLYDCDLCRCNPVIALTDLNGEADIFVHGGLDRSASAECCTVTTVVSCLQVTIPWLGSGQSTDRRRWTSPDLDGSCTVDVADYAIFQGDYMMGTGCRSDFDGDGYVGAGDAAIFTAHFSPDHGCWNTVGVDPDPDLPSREFRLEQNRPNPFGTATRIAFTVPEAGPVQLRVYDIQGRGVRTRVDAWRDAQRYDVSWDGRDDSGRPAPAGIYFYRVTAPGIGMVKRMVLVR
jgi:hypothetical protein